MEQGILKKAGSFGVLSFILVTNITGGLWNRVVLKTGEILLNFDAEYAKNAHRWLKSPENFAHQKISEELKDECHEIYHMLAIISLAWPVWDTAVLTQIGFSHIETDTRFGDRVYKERDEFYMPDRMFRIAAFREWSWKRPVSIKKEYKVRNRQVSGC